MSLRIFVLLSISSYCLISLSRGGLAYATSTLPKGKYEVLPEKRSKPKLNNFRKKPDGAPSEELLERLQPIKKRIEHQKNVIEDQTKEEGQLLKKFHKEQKEISAYQKVMDTPGITSDEYKKE